MWRDEPHLAQNGKTQVKTFNEVEKIPDKIQIKLNFLKTPQTLFNILKLSINYHKFSLSLLVVILSRHLRALFIGTVEKEHRYQHHQSHHPTHHQDIFSRPLVSRKFPKFLSLQ